MVARLTHMRCVYLDTLINDAYLLWLHVDEVHLHAFIYE